MARKGHLKTLLFALSFQVAFTFFAMGQRHQCFLIAKVAPRSTTDSKAYRSLGGFHHQWCYGRLPALATRRFIDLIKQKTNAEIIQFELDGIKRKYEDKETKMPGFPCPYALYLTCLAWCFNPDVPEGEDPYISGHSFHGSVLEARMGSFSCSNDDGITVIDITDPFNPAIGHVLDPSQGPISTEEYVRHYYPTPSDASTLDEEEGEDEGEREDEGEGEDEGENEVLNVTMNMGEYKRKLEENVKEVIASLDGVRMVTVEMLAEAWPREYKSKSAIDSQKLDHDSDAPTADTNPIPQLADLAIEPAVKQSIQLEDFSELEKLLWMPGKAALVKAALRRLDPFPDAATQFLDRMLTDECGSDTNAVDLSEFKLSSDQIVPLVSRRKGIQKLNLSKMPNISIDCVRQVLTAAPSISYLNLFDTPITKESIVDLLANEPKLFYNMEALLHPAFFAYEKTVSYKSAFAFPGAQSRSMLGGGCFSLPYFTPQKVVQVFTDYISIFRSSNPIMLFEPGVGLFASACLSSAPRQEGQRWGDREVIVLPSLSTSFRQGEGWLLAMLRGMDTTPKYAFYYLKPSVSDNDSEDSASPTEKQDQNERLVLDLQGFLRELEAEGRPPPSSASVERLQKLIDELGWSVMDTQEMKEYLDMLTMHSVMFARGYM